jgi:uncharacterized protein YndB with AHSA1/START domain
MSDPPKSSYDGTLERTAEGGVIRFERHLPYPIRDVWDAITDAERLADWWLPFDADVTVDLREGGELVFTSKEQEPMTIVCTILRVEAPMLLEHTHVDEGSYMRWELEPEDEGCVLRLSHFVTNVPGAIDGCYVVGLHESLARLAPCLAGHPVPWDWDAFAEAQAHYAGLGVAAVVDAP